MSDQFPVIARTQGIEYQQGDFVYITDVEVAIYGLDIESLRSQGEHDVLRRVWIVPKTKPIIFAPHVGLP